MMMMAIMADSKAGASVSRRAMSVNLFIAVRVASQAVWQMALFAAGLVRVEPPIHYRNMATDG